MTPEEQIETYKAIEESAAVIVVAELRLIRQAVQYAVPILAAIAGILFVLAIITGQAKAAPIESLPLPQQHWYTMDVPTPEGVFALEVYAPALPRITASDFVQIVEIGDPPRLADAPEPGTAPYAVASLLGMAGGFWLWRWVKR